MDVFDFNRIIKQPASSVPLQRVNKNFKRLFCSCSILNYFICYNKTLKIYNERI